MCTHVVYINSRTKTPKLKTKSKQTNTPTSEHELLRRMLNRHALSKLQTPHDKDKQLREKTDKQIKQASN